MTKIKIEAKGVAEPIGNENHGCCAMVVFDQTGREIAKGAGYVGVVEDGWEADYIALIKTLRYVEERNLDGAIVVIGQKVIVVNHIPSRVATPRLLPHLVEVLDLLETTGCEVVWEPRTKGNRASHYALECFQQVRQGKITITPFQLKYGIR